MHEIILANHTSTEIVCHFCKRLGCGSFDNIDDIAVIKLTVCVKQSKVDL